MTRHKLILEDQYQYECIGISCHLKDFRVAWKLNQRLNFKFIRTDFHQSDRTGEDHAYSVFKYRDEANRLNYFLVNNYSEDIPLVKAYRQFNLILVVEGYTDIFDTSSFVTRLMQEESFQLVTPLDPAPLSSLQYDLFEE